MDAPKCKTCGERHYGLCPGNKRTRASGRAEEAPIGGPRDGKGKVGRPSRIAKMPPAGVPAKRKAGRPRVEDRHKTLAAIKPWDAAGMSRATWYARQAEKLKP